MPAGAGKASPRYGAFVGVSAAGGEGASSASSWSAGSPSPWPERKASPLAWQERMAFPLSWLGRRVSPKASENRGFSIMLACSAFHGLQPWAFHCLALIGWLHWSLGRTGLCFRFRRLRRPHRLWGRRRRRDGGRARQRGHGSKHLLERLEARIELAHLAGKVAQLRFQLGELPVLGLIRMQQRLSLLRRQRRRRRWRCLAEVVST